MCGRDLRGDSFPTRTSHARGDNCSSWFNRSKNFPTRTSHARGDEEELSRLREIQFPTRTSHARGDQQQAHHVLAFYVSNPHLSCER